MNPVLPLLQPPDNELQLYQSACALTGHRLETLAARAELTVPNTRGNTKGWAGLLLEQTLGASSGSKPQQDFPTLGIELKTVPVDESNQPLESTFVCVAPLIGNSGLSWSTSLVRHKLQRVLWIPIVGRRGDSWTERWIGLPRLWSPSVQQEQQLQSDWEELMDHIVLGDIAQISAHRGEVLQLRPKAANSRVRTAAIDRQGRPISTLPLGFYLRTAFTAQLLA
jgi:DNA mismatch repair protein MutH